MLVDASVGVALAAPAPAVAEGVVVGAALEEDEEKFSLVESSLPQFASRSATHFSWTLGRPAFFELQTSKVSTQIKVGMVPR